MITTRLSYCTIYEAKCKADVGLCPKINVVHPICHKKYNLLQKLDWRKNINNHKLAVIKLVSIGLEILLLCCVKINKIARRPRAQIAFL